MTLSKRDRRWRVLSVACAGALALSACSGQVDDNNKGSDEGAGKAVKGGTLNLLGVGDVDYVDPNVSYYSIGYLGLRPWTRQLFTYPSEEGKVTTAVPDLAEEIPSTDNGGLSADGKTVTITIREGAKWNTEPARQVTAEDTVRGVKRTCNPAQPFGGIPDFADLIEGYQAFCDGFAKVKPKAGDIADYINNNDIPGVQAKDERTVVFTLTHPATYFTDMLTLPAFSPAPEEVLKYVPGSAELAQNQVSDGPYEIQSYKPTKSFVFVRNDAWDQKSDPVRKAYVDKIVVDETVSQESTQQQLETGTPNADMAFDNLVPASRVPQLLAKNDPNFVLGETASSNPYLVFNTVSPNNGNALQKVEVRQALEHAINRDALIQVLGGPKIAPPLTHVLPSNIVGSEDNDPYPYDTDKAKQLLSGAGADGMTIKVLYRNETESSRKIFATLQEDLGKAGIKVKGVPSPSADFYTKYLQVPDVAKRGVWDLAIAGWGADWYGNAALSYFAPLYYGKKAFPPVGSNFGFYDSDKTNSLIEQATVAKTEDEAGKLWAEADRQVMEDAAFFPITNPKDSRYHASQVHGAVYVPAWQNFDPTNVWLEEGKQGG